MTIQNKEILLQEEETAQEKIQEKELLWDENFRHLNFVTRLYYSFVYLCPFTLIKSEKDVEILSKQCIRFHWVIKIILFYYTIYCVGKFRHNKSAKNLIKIVITFFVEILLTIIFYSLFCVIVAPGLIILTFLFIFSAVAVLFLGFILLTILTVPQIIISSFSCSQKNNPKDHKEALKMFDNVYYELPIPESVINIDPLQLRIIDQNADKIISNLVCLFYSCALVSFFIYLSIFLSYF